MEKIIGDWLEKIYWRLFRKREQLLKEIKFLKDWEEGLFVPWKWDPETKEEREKRIRSKIALRNNREVFR
jgi:hypothetical protein